MKVTRSLAAYVAPPHPVATIGNFDGQHRGHQALLKTVVEAASRAQGTPMVVTFDPHPVRILAPQVPLRFLTSPEEKLAAFEAVGIQEVVFVPFTSEFASRSAEYFACEVLAATLGVREIFVGEHFAFGKGRVGRIADLERFGKLRDFHVRPVTPVVLDGIIVSSTRIRTMLLEGQIELATHYLGRRYALKGMVVPGQQRGRDLGWPTANLTLPPERVIPQDGVYAAVTQWRGQSYDSVAYVGTRPTFESSGDRLLEVYLLDGQPSLYGETISVEFVSQVRGDRTFANAEALAAQIERDVAVARERLHTLAQGQNKC